MFTHLSPLLKKVITVTIKGEVNKPGTYNLSKNSSFLDLINLAGGYTDNGYSLATQVYRKKLVEAETAIRSKLLDAISNSVFLAIQ